MMCLLKTWSCALSKPDPHGFIGGFDLSAVACIYGDAGKRSALGRRQRTTIRYFPWCGGSSALWR